MNIEVQYASSESDRTRTTSISLNELGYDEDSWNKLTESEQEEQIQIYVDGFDQPYFVVEGFNIQ